MTVLTTPGGHSTAWTKPHSMTPSSGRGRSVEQVGLVLPRQRLDRKALDRALALERTGRAWRSNDQVAAIRPVLLKWSDHLDEAYDALVELHAKALDEGNEGLVPYALGHLCGVALRLGRTDEAAALAAEHLAHAESAGQEGQRVQALVNTASVDAHVVGWTPRWRPHCRSSRRPRPSRTAGWRCRPPGCSASWR